MKPILIILAFLISYFSNAQDYFSIVVKNNQTTYNYPENAEITIINALGDSTLIKKDEALTLKGNYTLSIETPWNTEAELITSDGGILEIFALPAERRNYKYNDRPSKITHYKRVKNENKPSLERKEIVLSSHKSERYNLLAVFSNGLVFKYDDGKVRAWLENEEIEVTNHYLVQTPDGTLKLSFNPRYGEFWYVFEI